MKGYLGMDSSQFFSSLCCVRKSLCCFSSIKRQYGVEQKCFSVWNTIMDERADDKNALQWRKGSAGVMHRDGGSLAEAGFCESVL
jgi:hypothetical protein